MSVEIVKLYDFHYFVKNNFGEFSKKYGEICKYVGDAFWLEECNEERLYVSEIAINTSFEKIYDLWRTNGTDKVLVLESIDDDDYYFKIKCFECFESFE